MRSIGAALLLVPILLSAIATTGCSDEAIRDVGRSLEQAIDARWEAFREEMDRKTKDHARRKAEAKRAAQARMETVAADEEDASVDDRPAAPKTTRLDPAALAEIVAIAQRQHAQSLTVKLHGKTVLSRRWGHQDDLHAMMQMTYPIVALTMGQLVAEGKVPSLDTPLGRWLPAFREGKKGLITLRHVMTGRDGLPRPQPFPDGLYHQPYYVGFFAGSEIDKYSKPGEGQVLPGESVVLLGAVVKAAAGMPLDRWVATRLLEPLGIHKSHWRKDKAGNFDAWAGLWLPPDGAMKIGELVLNEGRWNGRQVLPRAWVIEATSPAGRSVMPDYAEDHGYGWRVGNRVLFRQQDLDRLRREGYPYADRMAPAVGGLYRSQKDLQMRLLGLVGKTGFEVLAARRLHTHPWLPCRFTADRRNGFQAGDYIGDHLIVNPEKGIVALHTVPWDGQPITRSIDTFEFDDLADRLDAAAR